VTEIKGSGSGGSVRRIRDAQVLLQVQVQVEGGLM